MFVSAYRYTELHYEFRAGDDDNNRDGGGLKFVVDVAQCHDVLFVVCKSASSVIFRYDARYHQRLTDVIIHDDPVEEEDTTEPFGLAACEKTAHVYVVEFSAKCIR